MTKDDDAKPIDGRRQKANAYLQSVWPYLGPLHESRRYSNEAIARMLNAMGITTRRGAQFNRSRVHKLIVRALELGMTTTPIPTLGEAVERGYRNGRVHPLKRGPYSRRNPGNRLRELMALLPPEPTP